LNLITEWAFIVILKPSVNAAHMEDMKAEEASKFAFAIRFECCHAYHALLITLVMCAFLLLKDELWELLNHSLTQPLWIPIFITLRAAGARAAAVITVILITVLAWYLL